MSIFKTSKLMAAAGFICAAAGIAEIGGAFAEMPQVWPCGTPGGTPGGTVNADNPATAAAMCSFSSETETFTVSGTGMVANYMAIESVPWANIRESVKELVIEDGITGVYGVAFSGFDNLAKMSVGSGITEAGGLPIWGEKLVTISVSAGNANLSSADGKLFSKAQDTLIRFPANSRTKDESYTIPGSVTHIGTAAFYGLRWLKSVTIGTNVKSIGSSAFNSVGLTTITIPEGVTEVGMALFSDCDDLTSAISLNPVPPAAPGNVHGGVGNNVCLYVPDESLADYAEADGWKSFPCIKKVSEYDYSTSVSGDRGTGGQGTGKVKNRVSVSVRGRTLNVSSPYNSALSIRMIDMRGKTVARYNVGATAPGRSHSFALTKIPAGQYFVEVRDGVGRSDKVSVVVGVK